MKLDEILLEARSCQEIGMVLGGPAYVLERDQAERLIRLAYDAGRREALQPRTENDEGARR